MRRRLWSGVKLAVVSIALVCGGTTDPASAAADTGSIRCDLKKYGLEELVIGYDDTEPFLYKSPELSQETGLEHSVLSALASTCKVRIRYEQIPRSRLLPNGNSDTFVPPKTVHIVAGGVPRTSKNVDHYLVVPYLDGGPGVAVRQEINFVALFGAFVNNLSTIVWLLVVIVTLFFVGAVLMYFADRVPLMFTRWRGFVWFLDLDAPPQGDVNAPCQAEEAPLDLVESLSLAVESSTTQGFGKKHPRNLFMLAIAAGLAICFSVAISALPSIWNQVWAEAQNSQEIGTLDQLGTKVVGTVGGTTAYDLIKDRAGEIVTTEDIRSALGTLTRGGVDVVVADVRALEYYARDNASIQVLPDVYSTQLYGFAVRRDLAASEEIDRVLTRIIESPEFQGWKEDTFKKRQQ